MALIYSITFNQQLNYHEKHFHLDIMEYMGSIPYILHSP